MSLQELDLTLDLDTLPTEVSEWIAEANRRREQFYEAGLGLRYPKYIPSNPVMVHAAIANLMADGQLRGDLFCEWGCGFGIAAGVASLLGLKAYGLEIETELAELATQLAADMKVPIEILQSNYLPEGFEEIEEMGGKELIAPESMMSRGTVVSPPEYDGLDPAEVDLFFVYPWPDQEELMMDLFSKVATDGAVLLLYREEGEVDAFLQCEEGEDFG
tara:strand:+ start:176 stop:826 length:651 start_codon:yes stop_codon:yes gene_type:complete